MMGTANPISLADGSTPERTASNFDNMTPAEFEARLPDLFASSTTKVSQDPRFDHFFSVYPDCRALVLDLETIADTARSLFEPSVHEPSDELWGKIASKLSDEPSGD